MLRRRTSCKKQMGGFSWGNAAQTGNALGLSQGIGGIGSSIGNAIASKSAPDKAGAFVGNSLSGLSQGAMAGSSFGPIGMGIGAAIGLGSGLIKSFQDRKTFLNDLEDKQKPREVNKMYNAYNPQARSGGSLIQIEKRLAERARMSPSSRMSVQTPINSKGVYNAGTNNYTPFWNEKQKGGPVVKPFSMDDDYGMADVEIEGGEAVLVNPNLVTMYGGGKSSNESTYGFMAHGAKHGQINEAGSQGIPISSEEEAYIGSDHLGLDGRKATKGNKSVAQEMKPYLNYLSKAEGGKSWDAYSNNPKAIEHHINELEGMKVEAEQGKFMSNLEKLLKKKDRNFNEVMNFIMQSNPNEAEALMQSNSAVQASEQMGIDDPAQAMMQQDPMGMQSPEMQQDPNMGMAPEQQMMDPAMEEQMAMEQMMQSQQPPMMHGGSMKWRQYMQMGGQMQQMQQMPQMNMPPQAQQMAPEEMEMEDEDMYQEQEEMPSDPLMEVIEAFPDMIKSNINENSVNIFTPQGYEYLQSIGIEKDIASRLTVEDLFDPDLDENLITNIKDNEGVNMPLREVLEEEMNSDDQPETNEMEEGDYVEFEDGGRLHKGYIRNYNKNTGDFDLDYVY